MSIGLLLITHDGLGQDLLVTATKTMGTCPLNTKFLPVLEDSNLDELITLAKQYCNLLETGDGVMVLTDMYGSTPSNVARELLKQDKVVCVAGVNLPMLVKVLNYCDLSLHELLEKALSGGRDGVHACTPSDN